MLNGTMTHDTVTEWFLDIMMLFISKDFDHKPWNYAQQFDTHIAPKKNEAMQLKKERFNRFAYACALRSVPRGRSMDFLEQVQTCNKQSCMCSLSIPGCRLSGDIPLGSSNPRCSPYWTIPCCHLQWWCDILRAHPCDAKAVWKPQGNNWYGKIAWPVQTSLQLCQWKLIQVTAVAQETSGCTRLGNETNLS